MDKIKIIGGNSLKGTVKTSGSKNSALPILFASLLAEGDHIFHNVPRLQDVDTSCLLLEHFGCRVKWLSQNTLTINTSAIKTTKAPFDLVRKMRASILSLGPLLARTGFVEISLPGGCAIGTRSIHLHLKGLQQMGAVLETQKGNIVGKTINKSLKGARILLDFPTVGGTQNLMMAACLAKDITVIENAAREPEIVDLADYLVKMGAVIKGAGSAVIKIQPGVLTPGEHKIIPDRIEAGTFLLAGAITKGNVVIQDCRPDHLESLTLKLKTAGFSIKNSADGIELSSPSHFSAVNIATAPYPGFPTDLQAQFTALLTQANKGELGYVKETIFENRFMHIQELVRLGADIHLDGHRALVRGGSKLQGAPVTATDLRASACLILAGLSAQGETFLHRVYHLDRGYEKLEKKLLSLGADIQRIK